MKVMQSGNDIVSVQGEAVAMKVNARKTSKLYFMISSSLYTDKFMSILRELCSNCRDSHNEAGKNHVPFTLIAPTLENPELVVSDAGIGLTYEKACSTILEFLGSTKDEGDDADDHIGGWGIGAKSLRAYSSNYTVVLRKGGKQWTVSVFDDERGEPQHILLLEEKTSRPDGVDMKMPIKVEDISAWAQTVRKYMGFTNYNVEAFMGNGEVVRPAVPSATYDYGKFKLDVFGKAYNHQRCSTKKIQIVYGGMLYDIPSSFGLDKAMEDLMRVFAGNIQLRIRVDTANLLRFGLSREHLEADPETVRFVGLAVSALHAEANALNGFECNYAKVLRWAELVKTNTDFRGVTEKFGTCRLQSVLFKPASAVTWEYPEGVSDSSGERRKTFNLPMLDLEPPVIKVVYSHKRMTSYDVDMEAPRGLRMVCPLRFKNRAAAEEFFKSGDESGLRNTDQSDLDKWKTKVAALQEEHELEFVYAESTWEPTKSVRSSGHKFLTCEDTEVRICVKPGETTLIDFEKPEHSWLRGVSRRRLVMLSDKARKRSDLEGFFIPLADFVESSEGQQLARSFHGIRELTFMGAVEAALRQVYKVQREFSLPAELAATSCALESELEGMENALNRACNFSSRGEVTAEMLDAVGFEVQDLGVEAKLKEVNSLLYVINKYENLFKVVDFGELDMQLRNDNPEAKRLVAAMGLEQFV